MRRRSVDVRRALVQAAESVLERDGLTGLTVRAVAAEAGVAPMGVYNHLDGKDGLVIAVLGAAFDELTAATAWRADLPPEEALRHIGQAYRRFALRRPVTYGLMFGPSTRLPHPGEQAGEHADRAFNGLVHALQISQQVGLVRAGDPSTLAVVFWAAVHGAVSLEIAGAASPETKYDETYAAVLDTIERGLAP